MGEEAVDDYELHMVSLAGDEDERVMEWESGLPSADELTPLSQALVPPGLAAAFRIPPEPGRTLLDVHRASAATVSRLRRAPPPSSSSGGSGTSSLAPFDEQQQQQPPPPQQPAPHPEKRPRLVWTPQLHKRFVDVVAHLGMKQAVPKTIMQLMNVEGLTRENVASHLQKYRLYVKRGMQGLSNDKDDIFASTPVPPHTLHDPHPQPQVQVPYTRHAAHYQYQHAHHHHHHHQSSSNGYHHAGGYPTYHHHGDK